MNTKKNMNRGLDTPGGKIKKMETYMGINTWTKVDEKRVGSSLVITEEFIPTG